MPCEGSAFAADAFHQVAIAADGVDVEIEELEARLVEIGGQPFCSNSHSDAVGNSLAERAGGGFDAGGDVRFGMTGSAAAELAKSLDFVHGDRKFFLNFTIFVYGAHAREVQCGIKKHGGVAGGENETITIGPEGIGGIVAEKILPERINHGSQTHGSAGMPGVGLLHGVDGKRADSVDAELV